MTEYTVFSFAPVQGFIEKSRKLRDLFGASLILSYLSFKLVKIAEEKGLEVISPGLPNIQLGMPNRIVVKGKLERYEVQNALLKEWQIILRECREWIENNLDIPENEYFWSQTEEEIGKHKGEWERWGSYTWEVFWGHGSCVTKAMEDLETRKLKRDWSGINWVGESSSLTGTDAIAWHQLGKEDRHPGRILAETEKAELKRFYHQLAWVLDNPGERDRKGRQKSKIPIPSDAELETYFKAENSGKFLAANERLSIPELVKRLITFHEIADDIGIEPLPEGFTDINRDTGYWSGWFMGDGDKVGDKLKQLAKNPEQLQSFTHLMRDWGRDLYRKKDLFPDNKGRIIYAGGDDFMGVLYSPRSETEQQPEKLKPTEVLNWLLNLPTHWQKLQDTTHEKFEFKFTYSVGFVWAGHQVPQRDILQHCREAEQRAKSMGRDRITIRVVFNSGRYVEWTCPWDYLHILKNYRDRDGKSWQQSPNWSHVYQDWAELKARGAVRLFETQNMKVKDDIAISLLNYYFDNLGEKIQKNLPEKRWRYFLPDDNALAIVQWIDDLIQVGWQLCSNT